LETNVAADPKELLLLSAQIATKVGSNDLSVNGRRRLAAVFHGVAYQIEAEAYANTSHWRAFWGMKTITKAPVAGDENA
jgi:hypothetical protein